LHSAHAIRLPRGVLQPESRQLYSDNKFDFIIQRIHDAVQSEPVRVK